MEQSAGADDDLDQYMADMKKDNVAAERRKLLLRIVELQKVRLALALMRRPGLTRRREVLASSCGGIDRR